MLQNLTLLQEHELLCPGDSWLLLEYSLHTIYVQPISKNLPV
jgi:hypothetical protein